MDFISQLIVAISIIPYIISIFRGTVKPNRISWFIWSIIGFTFWLVTPSTADNIIKMLTLIFFINPTIIFVLTLFKGENRTIDLTEKVALLLGLLAIATWYLTITQESLTGSILPAVIAITADICALIPTLRFVFHFPGEEQPFAWVLFLIGNLSAFIAIETFTFENLLLPIYMIISSFFIILPLVSHRIKRRIPLKNWIV